MSKFEDTVRRWMRKVDALEVHIEGKMVTVLMRKENRDEAIYIHGWLEGEITTPQFKEFLKDRYWWVGYPLKTFKDIIYNA